MSTGSGASAMTGSKLPTMRLKPTICSRLGFFALVVVGLLILQILTADMGFGLTLLVYLGVITVAMLVAGILRVVIPQRGEK